MNNAIFWTVLDKTGQYEQAGFPAQKKIRYTVKKLISIWRTLLEMLQFDEFFLFFVPIK